MKRIIRYLTLIRFFIKSPYNRAKLAEKIRFFKNIGHECYLCTWNFGTEPHLITLGNNVYIATGVRFINHDMSVAMISNYLYSSPNKIHSQAEIKIGNNVFIGADTIILPGVQIGDNIIIGAGSVVTKDIESDTVAAGVPAKRIRSFESYISDIIEE